MSLNSDTNSESVLVTGSDLGEAAVSLLHEHDLDLVYTGSNPDHKLICELASQHRICALIVRHGQIDEKVMTASESLKVIANHGAGYDNIDTDAANRLGVPVFVARGRNARSVAEHALMMILALYKKLVPLHTSVRGGSWVGSFPVAREFSGSTLGIVGFGAIGRELARIVRPFEVDVVVYDPLVSDTDLTGDITLIDHLDDLLALADTVSLHVPLTEETGMLIDADRLSHFKPGAILINTARGGVVDEQALADALKNGRLSAAGLDTFEVEPFSADHPLAATENVLLSPHIAGVTVECLARMSLATAEQTLCILRGTPEPDGDRLSSGMTGIG